jgi:hypothetical protein
MPFFLSVFSSLPLFCMVGSQSNVQSACTRVSDHWAQAVIWWGG